MTLGQDTTRLRLTVDSEELPLGVFLSAASDLHDLLGEVERAVAGSKTLKWLIVTIKRTSPAVLELTPHIARKAKPRLGAQVAHTMTDGLRLLEAGTRKCPNGFSPQALQKARRLSALRGRGLSVFQVALYEGDVHISSADVTERVGASIRDIDRPRYRNLGSVEGQLEMLSVHNTTTFNVYDGLTGAKIECRASRELLNKILADNAFGRRVAVFGEVTTNERGYPKSVNAEKYRLLRDRGDLPEAADLIGLYGDVNVSSADFGDYLRNEEDEG